MSTLFDNGSSAVLSGDRVYRYELRRIWDETIPPVLFVGMNPSTADEQEDDPTIRRCIGFARDWGYGGLLMGNLFAFRATDPEALRATITGSPPVNPCGEWESWFHGTRKNRNDVHLQRMSDEAGLVIAAWGSIKAPIGWSGQADRTRWLLRPVHALGLTQDGHPRHPLYIKAATWPQPMPKASRT